MNSLIAALNAKFAATTALTDLFTGNTNSSGAIGLHWDVAPSEANPPYVVAQVISAPSQSKYGGITLSDVTIQFKVLGVGYAAMVAAMETFMGVFDEFTPTLGSGTCSGPTRIMEPMPMQIPEEEKTGDEEWQVITQYVYGLEP